MKIIITILLLWVVSCSVNESNSKQTENSFVLRNVNIIDVTNQTIIPAKTVVIQQGKIHSIIEPSSTQTWPNLTIIDGRNGYITPGLIDMHVHMYEEAAYILALNHGVTHVRIMNGLPKQLLWRDNIESGLQLGSTSTVSSPILSGYKDAYFHHTVETAEDAKAAVQSYQSQGYDLIKAYGNLNETALLAIIEEGNKLGIPVAKHGPHASGHMSTSQLVGLQSFEHVEDIYQGPLNHEFSPERLPEILRELKATNVPITPTLNIYDQLTKLSQDKDAYLATTSAHYTSDIIALETSTNQVKRWIESSDNMAKHNQKTLAFLLLITKALNENDIPILVGSDSGVLLSPHGIATHNEMRLLEKSGLSTFEVLTAATINPAKALNLHDQIGKISLGYNADFIYSIDNPIQDLSVLIEPQAVIKQGHWYSRELLNKMKDDAIDARNFWDEFFVLFEAL